VAKLAFGIGWLVFALIQIIVREEPRWARALLIAGMVAVVFLPLVGGIALALAFVGIARTMQQNHIRH
jgi:hypothetical protein